MAGSLAQWPLLTEVLAAIESADSLEGAEARWRGLLDAQFEEVVGSVVRLAPRSSSLLDLALRFGHAEVARRLKDFGLAQRSLCEDDLQCLPTASLAGLTLRRSVPNVRGGAEHEEFELPKCRLSKEEALQRWYPSAERQGWASDWDVPVPLACLLVDVPATRAALALVSEGVDVDLSEEAEVRLLDAALLLGVPGAVTALMGRCGQQPPMRTWDGLRECRTSVFATADYVEAFLRAGSYGVVAAEFAGASAEEPGRRAMRMAADLAVQTGRVSLAQAVRGAYGAAQPPLELTLWGLDLVKCKADDSAARAGRREGEVDKVQLEILEALGASGAGLAVEVSTEERERVRVPVLSLAVMLGDEAAARRLVRAGHSFLRLGPLSAGLLASDSLLLASRASRRATGIDLPAGRLETAERILGLLFAAAVRRCVATLRTTRRRYCAQPETWQDESRTWRAWYMGHLAGFAATWSEGDERFRQEVEHLTRRDSIANCELWPQVAAVQSGGAVQPPSEPSPEARGGTSNEGSAADQTAGPAAELQGSPAGQPPASSSAEPPQVAKGSEGAANEKDSAAENEYLNQALQQSEFEAMQVEQADVQRAVLESKTEAFNGQVYALLRLAGTRSARVVECLLTSEALRACRDRVAAAGCKLQTSWSGGAVLLVPMTWELYVELGLNLRGHHVLMLQSDVDRLEEALRHLPCRQRPQVKRNHLADWYEGAMDDLGREEAAAGSKEGPRWGQSAPAKEVERPCGESSAVGPMDEDAAEGPAQQEDSFNAGPGEGSPAREEDDEQPGGEVVGAASQAHDARDLALAAARAAQEELLRSYGIVVQNTFWGGPANHFGLSAAPSAHSA